jgi:hypothetical protein
MNRKLAVVVTVLLTAGSLSACGSTAKPIPQAASAPPAAAAPAAEPAPAEAAPVAEVPVPDAAPAATTCDLVKEAILTGTSDDIGDAMKKLIADKSADGTAREYAQNYLVRDRDDKDLRKMDVSLIQVSCL